VLYSTTDTFEFSESILRFIFSVTALNFQWKADCLHKEIIFVSFFVFFLNSTEYFLAENVHLVLRVNNNPTDYNGKKCNILADAPQLSQSFCESFR